MAPTQYQCAARMPYWYAEPAQPISSSEPEVGRDEAQPGDPCGHLAAGHEELFAGVGPALEVEADPDHHHEVDGDYGDVEGAQVRQRRGAEEQKSRRSQRSKVVHAITITVSDLERRHSATLSLRIDCRGRPACLPGSNVPFWPQFRSAPSLRRKCRCDDLVIYFRNWPANITFP